MTMNNSTPLLFAAIPGAFIVFEPSTMPRASAPKTGKAAKSKKGCGQCTLCKCNRSQS